MKRLQHVVLVVVVLFLVIVFSAVLALSLKNTNELQDILEESVEMQALSVAVAAREILDAEEFDAYKTPADTDSAAYRETLQRLRTLQRDTGAEYIYALKYIDGVPMFIFDTDPEDDANFVPYDILDVHKEAFAGISSSGAMNVQDEWGTYNTAAVPVYDSTGKLVGIVCADISDVFMRKSMDSAQSNKILLTTTMAVTMCVMLLAILFLMRRVTAMQNKLFRMANYDVITGLPNRQFLLDYLARISARANKLNAPFALMFIDLDNFKKVNDGAGHDAGDELLRIIAQYIENSNENSKAFRPAAGLLNISARIGGDEFIQVVPGVATEEEAAALAQQLLDNFHSPEMDRFIEKFNVGLSIGIALFPYHSTNFNVLIKYADTAMYHAKHSTKHGYFVYKDEMAQEDLEKLKLGDESR